MLVRGGLLLVQSGHPYASRFDFDPLRMSILVRFEQFIGEPKSKFEQFINQVIIYSSNFAFDPPLVTVRHLIEVDRKRNSTNFRLSDFEFPPKLKRHSYAA